MFPSLLNLCTSATVCQPAADCRLSSRLRASRPGSRESVICWGALLMDIIPMDRRDGGKWFYFHDYLVLTVILAGKIVET